uniref:Sugar phosphate transporter domain-containing protein n=1 Tax=Chrysotila carterae TaxID=13221 RepID=A0A7S4F4F6_CHRCT
MASFQHPRGNGKRQLFSLSRCDLRQSPPHVLPRRASVRGLESRDALQDLHAAATQDILDGNFDHAIHAASVHQLHQDDDDSSTSSSESPTRREVCDEAESALSPHVKAVPSAAMLSLLMVICGCCCQAPYELIMSSDRGCGDLVSLAEAITGIVASTGSAIAEKEWVLPMRSHALLAAAGIAFSMLTNRALASPLPTAMLCTLKNGSLVANVIVGVAVQGKKYARGQVFAVLVVTTGLVLTAGDASGEAESGPFAMSSESLIAVSCLTSALLVRALSCAMQETAFQRSGRASASEMLFFRSALALPAYMLRASNIGLHAHRWFKSEVGGLSWPTIWLLLFANLVFDYLCKVTMTKLIATCGALHATLVLTVQKFVAFAISVVLLDSEQRASPKLWLGAALVLLGTIAYGFSSQPSLSSRKKTN